tara:strand:- start:4547 stop:5110 length:564 start_codon:yes stop_codon:yes gene_type:complete
MSITKNHYYLYIENSKLLNLSLIKKRGKFSIIYRYDKEKEHLKSIKKFRKECKKRGVGFYIVNNFIIANQCKADGLYLSSYNNSFYNRQSLKLIGSAHNIKEIYQKKEQGCKIIFLSRLFKTNYIQKKDFYGVIKFNLLTMSRDSSFVPLGGIRIENLNKLNMVNSKSFAVLSEAQKKPAKIFSRLF